MVLYSISYCCFAFSCYVMLSPSMFIMNSWFQGHQCGSLTRCSIPKKVWIYANELYVLYFFKNTEPNWFDLQLVRARFETF